MAGGNEGEVDDDECEALGGRAAVGQPQVGQVHVADVGVLQAEHPGIGRQDRIELAMADFDAQHLPCATRQQAVGEAAGGHADIQGIEAGAVDAGSLQGGIQLVATPRDETGRFGFQDAQGLVGEDGLGGACHGDFAARAVGEDGARLDQPSCQRAGPDQAPRDQRDIRARGHQ